MLQNQAIRNRQLRAKQLKAALKNSLTRGISNFGLLLSRSLFEQTITPVKDSGTGFVHGDSLLVSKAKNSCGFLSLFPKFVIINAVSEVNAVRQELVVVVFTAIDEEGF